MEYGREEWILIVVMTRTTGKNYNLVLTATTFEDTALYCTVLPWNEKCEQHYGGN
jgi:hypothetical protein